MGSLGSFWEHWSPLCPVWGPCNDFDDFQMIPGALGQALGVLRPRSSDALQREIGNSPITEKNWSDCRLTGKAVNRAQAHPAATVPTTGHATTILHTLELPSWSPRGLGATQTSTSTSACCTRTERSTSDEAFSRHTSCFSMKQAASNWPASRTTWSNQL